jgi:hypothetical protein
MLPVICCKVEMFSNKQGIYVKEDDFNETKLDSVPLEMAGAVIAQYCYDYNTNKIHLFGQEDFLESLIDDIKVTNVFMYKDNAKVFDIEVN